MWGIAIALLGKIPATMFSMFTGINFGSVFGAIGGAFSGLIKNIVDNWKVWLIALMITSNIFTAWEWQKTASKLTQERNAHAADIKAFKDAQTAANNQTKVIKQTLQKEAKADADQADAHYSSLLSQYHASLLRYGQHSGGSNQPGNNQLPTTQGSDGPGSSSQLPSTLVISGDDAQICAVNTARLQAVHDWATTLPKEKDALSVPIP